MDLARLLTLGVMILTLSGCTWIKNVVDDIFPPRTSSEQVTESINANFAALESLSPNVGVSIDATLLEEELGASFNAAVEEYDPDGVRIEALSAEFDLVRQAIAIDSEFSLAFDEANLSVSGSFTGLAAFSAAQDAILIRPAFDTFEIDEIRGEGASDLSRRAARTLANPLIRTFLDNINGEVFDEPIEVSLEIDDSLRVSKSEAFGSAQVDVDGETNVIEPVFTGSSVLISANSMNVLLELHPEVSAAEIVAPQSASGEQNVRYRDFERRFEELWLSRLDPRNRDASMEVQFAKPVLAQFLNAGLEGAFTARSAIPTDRELFADTIEFDRRQIDCDDVRQPFEYGRYRRRSCSYDCDAVIEFLGGSTRIRDGNVGCVVDRARCNVEEEARVAADNVARESARAAHNAVQETAVAACRAVRAASEFIAVGRFSGETEFSGQSQLEVELLRFDEDLSGAQLGFSGTLSANVKTEFSIQPYDLGYIFMCISEVDETIRSEVAFNLPNQSTRLSFAPEVNEEGELWLSTRMAPVRYNATIQPSPILGLLADNNFSSKCRVLDTILSTAVGAGTVANDLGLIQLEPEVELLIRGVASDIYDLPAFDIEIDRAEIELPSGRTPSLDPTWGVLSVNFSIQ